MQLRDKKIPVIGQHLSDEEKESVWERLCDQIPNYSTYREQTDRNINVYRLLPRDAEGADL